MRVPWTVRSSNQSILKETSPEYSLEGLMLKPKLQYFGHLMRRTDSLEKTLMLGKIEGRRQGFDPWDGRIPRRRKWQNTSGSVQFSSVAQSCPSLCDPMNCSPPGLPVHHQLPEFTQTHVHRVSDTIQLSHPLSSPSLPAPNPSQHQSLFQ